MSPTPAAWTTAAAATLRQEQKMTRPSPLQVLDADMPKWAAGGCDAAGVLAALEEAGYVVVERSLGPLSEYDLKWLIGLVRDVNHADARPEPPDPHLPLRPSGKALAGSR